MIVIINSLTEVDRIRFNFINVSRSGVDLDLDFWHKLNLLVSYLVDIIHS